ncbi:MULTISPECIES: lipid-transfer protein [Pseudomonas]|uniref:lipid-transfer protein n=1 Tax=Pseudomonas nitroreducens TaxID=46680 RepID=UPI001E4A3E6E|nr:MULTISPECIES: lipid-transfer protein [Pseudomonas]MCE4071477.1 lipid-transfer protein [Pseudomonas nitritireducens]MCE4081253.1 lipid-transfer protein [Pseudomonas nitroreducens]
MSAVVIAGVGMVPFSKPGKSETYDLMGAAAVRAALADAGLEFASIQQAYAGYVYGDSTCGQRALYRVGMSGIPVLNLNNNCASGSSALFLARQAVESGMVDCALAFGFEQMMPGALPTIYQDRPNPLLDWVELSQQLQPNPGAYPAPHLFGGAGVEHAQRYGTRPETFARIAVKARRHAANNDKALFRDPVTLEEVLESPAIYQFITRLQCCPPTCGAAAAIVCSEAFAKRHGIRSDVCILAQELGTDFADAFSAGSMITAAGFDISRHAAARVYEKAGVGPQDIDVCELHDCFTANELITYEALSFCPVGGAERFILDGDNTYGGQVVTNPSGGLLSKGHPLGATGLAQCYELVEQLRGSAGARQVEGARLGLQHNIGTGSACVVTLFGKH